MTYRASLEPGRLSRSLSTGFRSRKHPFGLFVQTIVLLGMAQSGWAGEITVQVSKRNAGLPVRAAAVCLGTSANPAQFGATLADEKGIARFDKVHARTELVLTVSKSGYKGRQVALGRGPRDRGVLLTLASGGGGPACDKAIAGVGQLTLMTSPSTHLAPGIKAFRINGGEPTTHSTRVTLDYVLTGEASHYRASERSDFGSAEWRPLESDLWLDLAGDSGPKTIYFQVGKLKSAEGAEIEILSNVAVDTIELDGG